MKIYLSLISILVVIIFSYASFIYPKDSIINPTYLADGKEEEKDKNTPLKQSESLSDPDKERIESKRAQLKTEWIDPPKQTRAAIKEAEERKKEAEERKRLEEERAVSIFRWMLILPILAVAGLYFYFLRRREEHSRKISILEKEESILEKETALEEQKEKKTREINKKWDKTVEGLREFINISQNQIEANKSQINKLKNQVTKSQEVQEGLEEIIERNKQEVKLEKELVSELRKKYPFIDDIILNRK